MFSLNDNGVVCNGTFTGTGTADAFACKGTLTGTLTPATRTIAFVLLPSTVGCITPIDLNLVYGVGYNSQLITVLGIITIGIPHANFIYVSTTSPASQSMSGVVQFNGQVGAVQPSLDRSAPQKSSFAPSRRND